MRMCSPSHHPPATNTAAPPAPSASPTVLQVPITSMRSCVRALPAPSNTAARSASNGAPRDPQRAPSRLSSSAVGSLADDSTSSPARALATFKCGRWLPDQRLRCGLLSEPALQHLVRHIRRDGLLAGRASTSAAASDTRGDPCTAWHLSAQPEVLRRRHRHDDSDLARSQLSARRGA